MGRIRDAGADVVAISNDDVERAKRMAAEIDGGILFLSDPSLRAIYAYGMKGEGMPMADMGYVVIDRAGRISIRRIDRQFGEHVDQIVTALKNAA